jgi:peptidoglycan hydrolase-like amidase
MLAVALATVKIGVFGLFHPVELEVRPIHGSVLVAEGETLEGARWLRVRSAIRIAGRNGAPAWFELSVPGKITRDFFGRLDVRQHNGEMIAIVELDREIAVGSIVAAEGSRSLPIEALKAQAVAARSFLAGSRHRHEDFDFCDTTHCQFLREAPPPGSPAHRAQAVTRNLALYYDGRIVAALYSANCGGRTRTLHEAGWKVEGYPYFGVDCPARGPVSGHRIGMCQTGAAEMARAGKSFREILAHYFPAASLEIIADTDGRAAW